jgi:hypothetical protein
MKPIYLYSSIAFTLCGFANAFNNDLYFRNGLKVRDELYERDAYWGDELYERGLAADELDHNLLPKRADAYADDLWARSFGSYPEEPERAFISARGPDDDFGSALYSRTGNEERVQKDKGYVASSFRSDFVQSPLISSAQNRTSRGRRRHRVFLGATLRHDGKFRQARKAWA